MKLYNQTEDNETVNDSETTNDGVESTGGPKANKVIIETAEG